MSGPGTGHCCLFCAQQFVPLKNEVGVIETMGDNEVPYKLWSADLLECPDCKFKLIDGFGQTQIAAHYEPDFKHLVEKYFKRGVVFIISGKRGAMRCFSDTNVSGMSFDDLDWSVDETSGVSSRNC